MYLYSHCISYFSNNWEPYFTWKIFNYFSYTVYNHNFLVRPDRHSLKPIKVISRKLNIIHAKFKNPVSTPLTFPVHEIIILLWFRENLLANRLVDTEAIIIPRRMEWIISPLFSFGINDNSHNPSEIQSNIWRPVFEISFFLRFSFLFSLSVWKDVWNKSC